MRICALVLALALVLGTAPETGARPAKGEGPTALAAGFGALWIGTARGELLRLDSRTGRIQKRVGKEPGQIGHVASVVAAFGSVWVSDSGLGVARVDPRRARPPRVVFPSHGQLAAGAGWLWAADPWKDRILKVDPARARVVASLRVPGRLVGLYGGPTTIYVVYTPKPGRLTGPEGPRLLQRLDPSSAQLVGRPVSFNCDIMLAAARNAIWTVDFCRWRVARREPLTLAVQLERPSPRAATFLTLAFGSVWVSGVSRVVRFDAATLRVEARLWVHGAIGAAGERGIWILDGSSVRFLDPRTNRIVRTFRVRG
jgi:hypothetical protein